MTLSIGNAQLLQAELDETGRGFFRLSVHGSIKFPPGDWNDGPIVKDKSTGKPCFARAVQNTFPIGKRHRTGIYEVQCPGFDTVVVAKFARFHWEIRYMESETTAYEWIKDYDIGPRFLGHPVEDGRVIGFLMERISNARHAVLDDLEACWDTLSRLHALGIRHGDMTQKCDDCNVLCEELDGLAESLASTSNRGGGGLL
ncbi:hypothetical protein BDV41DRAFT_562153 [Aspergillus transmontanensis]|uniref:Alpha-galactosidase A n=1 Tax=Aspergillus transmontanensis TaxID=1034304 RepID=A0A5N6W6R4_9EURO|nr:hypothetical protein BDV41DRAFT_562153 [Aspergillus transmontanensis]